VNDRRNHKQSTGIGGHTVPLHVTGVVATT